MSRALILLRVTDRSVVARQRLRATAARLREQLDGVAVLPAYVVPGAAASEPSLGAAVAQAVETGATEIAVVPYEVEWPIYDVNDNIQDLALEYPGVRIHLAQPLGMDGDVVPALVNRFNAAWSLPEIATATVDDTVVIAAQPPIAQPELRPDEVPQLPAHTKHVLICVGRVCQQDGSSDVFDTLTDTLEARGLHVPPAMRGLLGRQRAQSQRDEVGHSDAATLDAAPVVKITRTKCLQPCAGSPVACVYPEGTFFYKLTPDLVPRFVDEVLVGNGTLVGHTFRAGAAGSPSGGRAARAHATHATAPDP